MPSQLVTIRPKLSKDPQPNQLHPGRLTWNLKMTLSTTSLEEDFPLQRFSGFMWVSSWASCHKNVARHRRHIIPPRPSGTGETERHTTCRIGGARNGTPQ